MNLVSYYFDVIYGDPCIRATVEKNNVEYNLLEWINKSGKCERIDSHIKTNDDISGLDIEEIHCLLDEAIENERI